MQYKANIFTTCCTGRACKSLRTFAGQIQDITDDPSSSPFKEVVPNVAEVSLLTIKHKREKSRPCPGMLVGQVLDCMAWPASLMRSSCYSMRSIVYPFTNMSPC
eukprot:847261-Amphidinium_carterae.1